MKKDRKFSIWTILTVLLILLIIGNNIVYAQEENPTEDPQEIAIAISETATLPTTEPTQNFTVTFQAGNNPDDISQDIEITEVPTDTQIFEQTIVPTENLPTLTPTATISEIKTPPTDKEITAAILSDFMNANSDDPYAYISRDLMEIVVGEKKQYQDWLVVFYVFTDSPLDEHIVIGFYQEKWFLVSEFNQMFNEYIDRVPDELLTIEERINIQNNQGKSELSAQAIYTYELPFAAGTTHKVSQDYSSSHPAYDFSMSAGTPIYAVSQGEVISVKENTKDSCYRTSKPHCSKPCEQSGNYIVIKNNNGNRDVYVHIKLNGSVVNIGDNISKGQLIGYSGNTGCSEAPHLHYQSMIGASGSTSTQVYFNPYGSISYNNKYCSINNVTQIPTPTSPISTIYDRTPVYKWKPVACATKYIIQVYKNSEVLEKEVKSSTACNSTLCSYDPGKILESGQNKFRVKAYVDGIWFSFSNFLSFNVAYPLPVSPISYISKLKPDYSWNTISGATKYQIQVYKGTTQNLSKTISNSTICSESKCKYTSPVFLKNLTTYRWRLRAYVNGSWTSYSDFVSFITP
ncbi:MAG: M23 family metallopeptidase [Anaerolineae bacterium]|nr:M23 family metallopeptidase [Anaerolineae bacterium]